MPVVMSFSAGGSYTVTSTVLDFGVLGFYPVWAIDEGARLAYTRGVAS